MIELYELRQFSVFADCGTLSEAAEILHLSQPALSRNMKKLEEEIGVPLFNRRKNRLELNENGEYVLSLVKKLLNSADALTAKAQAFDRQKIDYCRRSLCPGSHLACDASSHQLISGQDNTNRNRRGRRTAVRP